MKRIVIAAFAAVVGLGLFAHDAEAKRLGGGKSAGMSRDSSITKREAIPAKPAAPTAAAAPAAAAKPASGMSRWLGPIAGLAAGLGIAALLSHFGMGEGMANFLMIAVLVMAAIFVVRLLFRKREPAGGMQYAGAGAPVEAQPMRFDTPPVSAGGTAAPAAASGVPADFDVEGFLRQAKLNFIRLQAANDRGDMDDIREFTTPEFFAEVKMQFGERGQAAQQTDVVTLNAELLDVTAEDKRHVVSVRFSGQLREEANAAPEAFREVWHLVKPLDGSRGWTVAGIQQD